MEFDAALRDKIIEEALEVAQAKTGDELVSLIDAVDLPNGSDAARYYAADPMKYPELPVE